MTNTYPRESVEFMALDVKNGATAVTDYQVQVTPGTGRPTPGAWVTNTTLDGKRGLMISGLARGSYAAWVKVTANPEIPVLMAGFFSVT